MIKNHSPEDNARGSLNFKKIIALFEAVNDRALASRARIALERNVDPNAGPVSPEHWQVILQYPNALNEKKENKPLIAENPSIYVSKTYFRIDYAQEILVNAVVYLNLIRNENNEIDAISRERDVKIIERGLAPRRKFEGPLFTVKFYDELVITKLAAAYSDITGVDPTMGEDKGSDSELVRYAGRELRGGRHRPFPTFLREVIKLGGLRRLNGSEFSYGVLRATWYRIRQADQPLNTSIDEQDVQRLPVMTTKRRPGRPNKGAEPSKFQAKLRGEAADMEDLVIERCTDREVMAIFGRARETSD